MFGYSVISRELTPHVLILLRSVTLPYRFLVFHRTTDRSLTCSVNLLNRVPHGIVNQLIRSMLLHKPNKPKEMRAAFQRTWINQFRCFCLFICLFLFFFVCFFFIIFCFRCKLCFDFRSCSYMCLCQTSGNLLLGRSTYSAYFSFQTLSSFSLLYTSQP